MIQDRRLGKALMLRDTQGVAPNHVVLPMEVVPIVARFAGKDTCAEIASALSKEAGETVPVSIVVQLASELEEAMFVDGTPYRKERARIEKVFADAAVREASHAGGAYHDDPTKLAEYIDSKCRAAGGRGDVHLAWDFARADEGAVRALSEGVRDAARASRGGFRCD